YILTAMDLRALEAEFKDDARRIIREELSDRYSDILSHAELGSVTQATTEVILESWETTSTLDATERMHRMASSSSTILLDFFTREKADDALLGKALAAIPRFRQAFATRATSLLDGLRRAYLTGERGPAPASSILNKTKPVYEFVRKTLGIRMSGVENYQRFPNGHGLDAQTSGQDISLIHEAIRDGRMQNVIVNMFA
ncbi:hypothetical protein MPER_06445, partial [Moniliophthora perniciosa FA553]